MRKKVLAALGLILSITVFSMSGTSGIIYEQDFRSVGIDEARIEKAKEIVIEASRNHQLLMLERKKLEIEINQYMLEGPGENWESISKIFDKMGDIEAELMKNKLKSQIEMRRYITQEEYERARNSAIKRQTIIK